MDCVSDAIGKFVEWSEKAKELCKTRSNGNGKYSIPNEKSDDGMLGDCTLFPGNL